jgi:hypothetical protein
VKTVAEKLMIKSGNRVSIDGSIDIGPHDGELVESDAEIAIMVAPDAASLRLEQRLPNLEKARAVWFCYPKGNVSDLNRDTIWAAMLEHGWRINGNVAIDDYWSAVRARPLQPGESALLP